MPRPKPKTPVTDNPTHVRIDLPYLLSTCISEMAQKQRRDFTGQLLHTIDLGLAAETKQITEPKAVAPEAPPARPRPAPLSFVAIRMLAHELIDRMKGQVTVEDLPYLLGEIEAYSGVCRELIVQPVENPRRGQ